MLIPSKVTVNLWVLFLVYWRQDDPPSGTLLCAVFSDVLFSLLLYLQVGLFNASLSFVHIIESSSFMGLAHMDLLALITVKLSHPHGACNHPRWCAFYRGTGVGTGLGGF